MKIKTMIYAFSLIFILTNFTYSEQEVPEFVRNMTTEQTEKWNNLFIELQLARNNKQLDKSIQLCAEVLKMDRPSGEMAYAKTYRAFGKNEEAIIWAEKAYTSAKEQNLSVEPPLLLIASCYSLMGNDAKANQILEEIIKLYPERPLAYKFYAEYYEQIGNSKQAIHYWQEALKRFTDERAIEQAKERIAALEKSK